MDVFRYKRLPMMWFGMIVMKATICNRGSTCEPRFNGTIPLGGKAEINAQVALVHDDLDVSPEGGAAYVLSGPVMVKEGPRTIEVVMDSGLKLRTGPVRNYKIGVEVKSVGLVAGVTTYITRNGNTWIVASVKHREWSSQVMGYAEFCIIYLYNDSRHKQGHLISTGNKLDLRGELITMNSVEDDWRVKNMTNTDLTIGQHHPISPESGAWRQLSLMSPLRGYDLC
ncbi:uncharacterized protein MELLADRAFT_110403 [Melampsora larici-populina 98AG31]|uniref:Uncharacterized protein n=1 Tax=Melampsora larici-populina (strain 98AG31 / pathotype 3-4-7) TaxID=747676 RepID=F4RZQ0_MELLP|nr:uncharacterized protein MELLADRAFT_110403 [Melampsora larici-populina 98AG31]EGG02148.1 hypothetical protein MELLADRAFT_110403 [Melampsora larici-populina 98AG31]